MLFKSYHDAVEYMGDKNDRPFPKWAGSPRDTRIVKDQGGIAVRYHWTNVVVYYPNYVVVNSGDWHTHTTKKRINECAPCQVYQKSFVWFFGDDTPFYDGAEFRYDGTPYPKPINETSPTCAANIPDAPYYVLSNDSFMSGWGCAQGKINTLILPCYSWKQAQLVERNALARSDQKHVRIVTNKPRLQNNTHWYSLHNERDYSEWYTNWPNWL